MTKTDYEAVKALYEEPGTLAYMHSFFEGDDEEAFFDSYVKHMYRFYDFGMYVLEEKETGAVIGHVGLGMAENETGDPVVTLGYVTGSSWRRKGIAYWACVKILTYAKEVLELDRIDIQVHPENVPSIALARKLEHAFPGFARLFLAK